MSKFLTGCLFLLALALAAPEALAQGDFNKGVSYYKQKEYAKAAAEFEALVKAAPDYESGWRILGDCYLNLRRYGDAIEAFREAYRLKNDHFPTQLGLAVAYYQTGRHGDAINVLLRAERFAATPADKYKVLQMRGSSFYNQKQYARAVEDLQNAIRIKADSAPDHLQLALSYQNLKDFDNATAAFNRVLQLDPDNPQARKALAQIPYDRGVAALEAKQFAQAIAEFSKVVQINPGDGAAYFNLGLAYLFSDNLAEAERALSNAARLMPNSAEVHDRLGFLYEVKRKDYPRALASYRKAYQLKKDPKIQESIDRVSKRIEQKPRTTRIKPRMTRT